MTAITRILGSFNNNLLIAVETPFHLDFRFCEMCRLLATRAGGGRISVDASSQESSLEHDNGGTEEGENGSDEDGHAGISVDRLIRQGRATGPRCLPGNDETLSEHSHGVGKLFFFNFVVFLFFFYYFLSIKRLMAAMRRVSLAMEVFWRAWPL